MPAIYSAEKVKRVWEMWQHGHHRFQIALSLNIDMEHIDGYLLAAAKKFVEPRAAYKKRDNTGPTLFTTAEQKTVPGAGLPSKADRKKWATYSNQQSKY